MRFYDKKLSVNEIAELIDECYDSGIFTHHSSFEYNSYELYTSALRLAHNRTKINHIVKLAAPHFEEDKFSSKTLIKKVDDQLKSLNIEQIEVLQWLVRSKPINDTDRLGTLENQENEISDCLSRLKQDGKVKSIFSFPYSKIFAKQVMQLEEIDGIISYLNEEEIEYSSYANNNQFIAIRPLLAGKLLSKDSKSKEKRIKECLEFVGQHRRVLSQIVSINNIEQLQVFKDYTFNRSIEAKD